MRLTFPNLNTDPGHAQGRLPKEERLMRPTTKMTSTPLAMLSVLLMTVGFAGFANAAEVYLQAQSFDKAMPDGASVPMWGFAECDSTFTTCSDSAPGPQINAVAGEILNIHVQNTLSVPVSIVIPGQVESTDGTPTMMGTIPDRVRSFTSETEAGTGGVAGAMTTYTWNSLNAGTYLYQSGTFPSIEVPMGLYGALVVADAVAGEAYGHPVDAEAVLLLSEIDPIQNERVADAMVMLAEKMPGTACVPLADFEQNMTVGYPCTVDYSPNYFLVNGAATINLDLLAVSDPPAPGTTNTSVLRFLNAGLRSHTPSIVGVELGLIAEDGNAYRGQPRNQSAVLLAAGKTIDALIATPDTDHTFSLFDRMPTFSNENLPNGGSFATLTVGAGTPDVPPPASLAVNDSYVVPEDCGLDNCLTTPYSTSTDSVLDNDSSTLSGAMVSSTTSNGTLVLDPLGTFTYAPNQDFSGTDSFTYSATDGTSSYGAQVMLNVSFVNDVPKAAADTYANNVGSTITVAAPGVLANDMDADGDQLYAVLDAGSVTLNADGSFTTDVGGSFTYFACDRDPGLGACPTGSASTAAAVDLTVNDASGIALIVQEPDGITAVTDYRWTLEEDNMYHPDPANPTAPSLATGFHRSYMPVVAQGCVGATACSADETETLFSAVALDETRHYYVSVLPADAMDENTDGDRLGHTVGGAQVLPGATEVTVITNTEPLPYAQISILIFEDSSPTNGAVDLSEQGLGGFQITLEDAGGRYGISAGAMSQDADGTPLTNALDCFNGAPPLSGVILSCPRYLPDRNAKGDLVVSPLAGRVLIKNLFPAKYGIITTAPQNAEVSPGVAKTWVQTSTIEGTKVIDAWVKAGEPPFFTEFGPVGVHAFVGFVSPEAIELARPGLPTPNGTTTITGAITNHHMSRPPDQTLWDSETYDALAHTRPWVGLNSTGGIGPNIAAVQADVSDEGIATFEIPDVPLGFDYQIVIWDSFLDQVIAYRSVTAANLGLNPAVGNIPVFQWFARLENHVFLDVDGDGKRGDRTIETALSEQAVNLRWRDGSVYQSFPTDLDGFVPFDQVFPFFNWLVAEVDYGRFEATGLTVTVDHGGDVSMTGNVYNSQVQGPCTQDDVDNAWNGCATVGAPYVDPNKRTETGQVLTQGFQGFLGQTSVFEWGKRPYEPGMNGGISGIVYYGVTRAESDPRLAAAEPWEPGIARVPVRLYRVVNGIPTGLAVTNAGFEDPLIDPENIPAPDGSGTVANVPGWIEAGPGRILNPSNNNNVVEGRNSYRADGSTMLTQQLVDVLEEGTYTLSVAVGDRPSATFNGYQVQIGVENAGFQLLAEDNNTLIPESGFLTSTVSFNADARNPNLGLPLVIRLIAHADEALFDDVRLTRGEGALALVAETVTDSWDDSLPTGCPGAALTDVQIVGGPIDPTTGATTKCYDGLRNFNQARPAVFDGGYAFNDIPAGEYVVEVVVPQGYELMKEEDINVSSGDGYASVFVPAPVGDAVPLVLPDYAMVAAAMAPEPGLAQPPCVGELRKVPDVLSLFPKRLEEAPFRRALRPLCDRKQVILSDQGQAAADFTLHTDAPIAAHFTGMVLDDVAQEFNPLSPQFGEKWAPPFVPVSIRDYNGEEISRVYSDQWGRINGLMPSTFTANMPSPSGFSPAMHMTCMNDPGPVIDTVVGSDTFGQLIQDRQYNPAYSNFCYTFQYMPGTTTYLDTPVLPVSAFASGYNPPDCSLDTLTPMIHTVDGNGGSPGVGPLVSRSNSNGPRGTITITSMGMVDVPNPAYEGPLNLAAGSKTIQRDFGFGSRGTGPNRGTVKIGGRNLTIVSWADGEIVARTRDNTRTGQLVVTRSNGNASEHAITVTVYNNKAPSHSYVSSGQKIQAAIDNASRGELIMVEPGVYNESVIMWKPVLLQGAGAGSTMINAVKRPTQVLIDWRDKMDDLFAMRPRVVNSLPNQLNGAAGFTVSEGAAITVLGRNTTNGNRGFRKHDSRIDGFSVTGADVGGGILVNSYAHNLEVSNNHVYGNNGSYHGGIRIGQPFLELPPPQSEPGEDNSTYELNTGLDIHNNSVTQNGGLGGAGGGISITTGSDGYTVSENFVCGNFTTGDGGGIGHLGLSDAGRILNNTIVHNQSFNQAIAVSGGGLFIGGEPVVVEAGELDNPDALSTGSGDVTVRFNRIQGNQAGAGHGGGIRAQSVNGWDIGITGDRGKWYNLRILDNVIVNNVAGWSGGGISLHNTVRGVIRRNTIAHNDSTATVGGLIVNNLSAKQPAGVSTESHSVALAAAISIYDGNISDQEFSTPAMSGNILWENRSFNYEVAGTTAQLSPVLMQATVGECDRIKALYWDLDARIANWQAPDSGATGPTSPDPGFGATAYCNGGRTLATPPPGPMYALPALDEGGNAWIDVRYGPLTRTWPAPADGTGTPWSYVTP